MSQDLGECYQQCFPRVFAYIYGRIRDTRATEDLAAEICKRAFAKALPDEGAFATSLFTIARDLLISHSRRQHPLRSLPCHGAPEHDPPQPPEVARILGHLRHLPLREQDIIALKFDAQLTNAQVAEVMGLTEVNVRMILYRTLQKLRKALEQEA